MKINKFNSLEEASASAGEALNKLLNENKPTPTLLLLSAGSAFAILDYINASSLSENLTITMLDERFSEDPLVNNFLQLQKLDFYTQAVSQDVNFIGTLPRKNESPEDLAHRLNEAISQWLNNNKEGKIFATFGMGADGHTAGIFPETTDKIFAKKFEAEKLFVYNNALGKHQFTQRITASFTLFKKIDSAVVFICGKTKAQKFNALINKQSPAHLLPALGIFESKQLQIFSDILE